MSDKRTGFFLLLPGGGSSSRFGTENKLLQDLNGLPVFLHAVRSLVLLFDKVIMAVPEALIPVFEAERKKHLPDIPVTFISGGLTRMESVLKLAEAAAEQGAEYVAIHDAARPLIQPDAVLRCADICRKTGAALLCHRITDTLKRSTGGTVAETVPRNEMFGAETPQMFRLSLFLPAIRKIFASGVSCTDDAQVMELSGIPVSIVENVTPNLKITLEADLQLCRAIQR